MFSPQQDVELGKRAALDAAKQLPMCNAPKVDAYLTQLGLRLASKLPAGGVQYPFEFHCVNDKAINAFALPGGYVFINRGVIESADNEAQLAAVMAHELSHVALRHGTNQATKAQAAQGFLGIASGIFGGSTGGTLLTELGAFAAGGVLLRRVQLPGRAPGCGVLIRRIFEFNDGQREAQQEPDLEQRLFRQCNQRLQKKCVGLGRVELKHRMCAPVS